MLSIGQCDNSIAAHIRRAAFKFAQIGLEDVEIALNERDVKVIFLLI